MAAHQTLQPTLWRTCRAIANRTRLRMFQLLLRGSGQSVSDIADSLNLPLSVASQYLRTLEARGILNVKRVGRRTKYRVAAGQVATVKLNAALRQTFCKKTDPVEIILKLATAFTHPRRIAIFRTILAQPQNLIQLRAKCGVSYWALLRHVRKLESRGFIRLYQGFYYATNLRGNLDRELRRMAEK